MAGLARVVQSPRRSLRAPQPGAIVQDEPPRLWYTKKRYALAFLLLLVVLVVFGLSRVGGADSATASAAGATSASSSGAVSPSVEAVGSAVRSATS